VMEIAILTNGMWKSVSA